MPVKFGYHGNSSLTSSVPVRPCACVFDWRETPWMSGSEHQLCGWESGRTSSNDTHRLVHMYLLQKIFGVFNRKPSVSFGFALGTV